MANLKKKELKKELQRVHQLQLSGLKYINCNGCMLKK